jgi:hypothetical protein
LPVAGLRGAPLAVAHVVPSHDENHFFGDIRRVVGNAFEVLRDTDDP